MGYSKQNILHHGTPEPLRNINEILKLESDAVILKVRRGRHEKVDLHVQLAEI